jgi:hypothetical protein
MPLRPGVAILLGSVSFLFWRSLLLQSKRTFRANESHFAIQMRVRNVGLIYAILSVVVMSLFIYD